VLNGSVAGADANACAARCLTDCRLGLCH
jgi:hypothetical protein